ncbi:MAG: tetratricopeptide repeat protein [Candidatus Accumulibacter sp.]|uniref:tetratricopeptide repeat protein n=1 Tax=Accumulibacter sp. TaxID=2053492 RepID=UPI001A4A4A7E|nr:tetratricopeptide repeat protein [Accumulibacter sp.]MBL8396284.1 tetratricopeptide repeat protein [Accumulibacter sp.]
MLSTLPKQFSASLRALIVGLLVGCCVSTAVADELAEAERLLKQGQALQALDKVELAIAGKPRELHGRFLKGLILTEMGRQSEAITLYTQISEDYPELPEPYNNLAVLYAQQKQYDRARQLLEMAIRTHPGYALARENLGDVYVRLASQSYDEALRLDASNKAMKAKLAQLRELGSAPATGGRVK